MPDFIATSPRSSLSVCRCAKVVVVAAVRSNTDSRIFLIIKDVVLVSFVYLYFPSLKEGDCFGLEFELW